MSQLIDKCCPVCGSYIKLHTGDVHSCSSCPFKCFEEDFDRVCKAMNDQAKLDALKAAVMPVVDWWKEKKPSLCTDKWPDFYILEYRGKTISLRQLELLEKILEGECQK